MQWQSICEGLGDRPLGESASLLNDIPMGTTNSEVKTPVFPSLSSCVQDTSPLSSSLTSRISEPNLVHDLSPESMFPSSGCSMAPSFSANDIHRSTSQPAKTRRNLSVGNFSMTNNSRDTLYAHEVLKSFRARAPDSGDRQAACDYCRKRKIKARFALCSLLTTSVIERNPHVVIVHKLAGCVPAMMFYASVVRLVSVSVRS